MASFKIGGFDEIDRMFARISKPQEFQTKAVKAAAPYLVSETKKAIKEQGGGDGLVRSIEATEPKANKYGSFVVVKPVGKRVSDGTPYVKLAAALEYGTVWPRNKEDAEKIHHADKAGKPKNKPHSFRDKALNAARSKVEDAMRDAVYREVDKLT